MCITIQLRILFIEAMPVYFIRKKKGEVVSRDLMTARAFRFLYTHRQKLPFTELKGKQDMNFSEALVQQLFLIMSAVRMKAMIRICLKCRRWEFQSSEGRQ